jgi:ABC-2 type transport system ATP-binding protein
MDILSISNLNKVYYPNKKALDNLSFNLQEGDFLALLGPNGAGKSTFINILAGLVNKTSGQIIVNGFNYDDDLKNAKKSIGVVPQEIYLDPFLTVYESLEIYAGYYEIPKSQRKTRDLIEILGLADKAHVKPRSLSGGMRRRLLIAKALIHSPPLVILDEPTAGVDIELREALWQYMKELNAKGTSIILTTHYLEEAEELCNKLAIINKGQIIAYDNKKNLLQILDNKKITISFAEKITQIPVELKKFYLIEENEKTISIKYRRSEISIDQILNLIIATKQKIVDIQTTDTDLQDVFKYLINKKVEDIEPV